MQVSDADIQRWVTDRYGFAPRPSWIAECKDLYLVPFNRPNPRPTSDRCPPDKRLIIREAFVFLGLLADQQRAMTGGSI
jgi:hypothetical protein